MRVLVCGSRHFNDYELLKETLDVLEIGSLIHGAARGADMLGGRYAEERGIPVRAFPAQWDEYGKSAGPIRNGQMLKEGRPDLVVAFRAPNSRGTQNMITQAKKANIEVKIVEVGKE